jgi:hypothetical protein
MAGTIATFMKEVKQGQVSSSNFLKGLLNFAEELENQVQENSQAESSQSQLKNDGAEPDLCSAVDSFVMLTVKTCENQLPSHAFLNMPFRYEASLTESDSKPLQALVDGLDSLVQIHLKARRPDPLQQWAYIATAANFSTGSPGDTEELNELCDSVQGSWHSNTADASVQAVTSGENIGASPKHQDQKGSKGIGEGQNAFGSYSLGFMIELFYGVREDCIEDDNLPGYQRAFTNWNALLRNFVLDQPRNREFRASLSPSQTKSARLLLEWWNGEIEHKPVSKKAFEALQRAATTGLLNDDAFELLGVSKQAMTGEKSQYYLQRYIFDASGSPYPRFMFLLYQMEFLPYHYSKHLSRKTLQRERNRAAQQAACQRIAVSCYKSLLQQCGLEPRNDDEHIHPSMESSSSETDNEIAPTKEDSSTQYSTRPRSLGTESYAIKPATKAGKSIDVTLERHKLTIEELHRLSGFIHGEPGFKIDASISSCPWLGDVDAQDELPYYLWDINQKCTVVAGKIKGEVEYTAISHTWGRWVKEAVPPVQVDGVFNWRIPENSKFEVKELPTILASLPVSTPYVWFDLTCIPQKHTDPALVEVSRREIGRQAKIFRRAKYTLAWLNEIDSWEGMKAAIRRLSVHYLQEGNDEEIAKSVLDLTMENTDLPLELFDSTSADLSAPEALVNGWFSSLWTLQELCLRPDMRLCNKNWEILSVGRHGETIVGMDDVIALAEGGTFQLASDSLGTNLLEPVDAKELQSRDPVHKIAIRSKATEHLWELLDLSGLEHLLNASQATILALGNQRYCKENRAEAIMSAIGITDWYNHPEDRPDSSARMYDGSLDQYPVSFVREAAEKIGAEFYATCLGQGELVEALVLSFTIRKKRRKAMGSMLPFTSSLLSRSPSLAQGLTGDDHPSVSSWVILPDGSVEISEVGIVSYTGQHRSANRNLTCNLVAPGLGDPPSLLVDTHTRVDLDMWVDSFIPTTSNFAVCLHHGPGIVDGILLKKVSSQELIKVGSYVISKTNAYQTLIPVTSKVKWRVL